MNAAFEKLNKLLLQRGVSLNQFQQYLFYLTNTAFPTLDTALQRQRIPLEEYAQFLRQQNLSPFPKRQKKTK